MKRIFERLGSIGFGLPSLESDLVNERKFAGDAALQPFVAALLDSMLLPDRYNPEGHVNSVYFDTPQTLAVSEKDNGDNLKRKVRVRWYGRPETLPESVPVFLELKHRIGSARRKIRVETTAPRALLAGAPLDDSRWPAIFADNAAALGEPVGAIWTPVCRIEYDRLRYNDLEGSSRVSLDWNIAATAVSETRFPQADVPVALDRLVCEFKNRGGAPPRWADEMLRAGLRLQSFSKYGSCMERIQSGIPSP